MTLVRTLTPIGNKEFVNFIIELKKNNSVSIPYHFLDQPPFSTEFISEIGIEKKQFSSRFEFGQYLNTLFESVPRDKIISNEGLWNWLSLFWIDDLIPVDQDGSREVRELARYVYNPHYTSFYRHLVASSWDIYYRYKEESKMFLFSQINMSNQFILNLACRQNIISNKNLIQVVQSLYWTTTSDNHEGVKKGSFSKKKPGNLFRLIAILNQLDTTYDLYGMNSQDIISLLPAEFDAWKSKSSNKPKKQVQII